MPTLEDALRRYAHERRIERVNHQRAEAWG
jgi:hypothetical protein